MATLTGLTIEDFERLPLELAHNRELVDGELIDVSGNVWEHNKLRHLLARILSQHCKAGVIITEQDFDFGGNAHGPDVSFIGPAKVALIDRKRRVQRFVPDLAIEIVSENDTFASLLRKAQRYRTCGTREVWILSIDTREAFCYSGAEGVMLGENGQLSTDQIPGFSIGVGELFDGL